jgi:hypothetical protein
MQGIVRAARHLALIALLLRALVPAGWMPGTAADAPFVICSVDGAAQHTPDGHKPADDASHQDGCPFAAASHLAKTSDTAPLAAPLLRAFAAPSPTAAQSLTRIAVYRAQSPRAPPSLA